MGKLINSVHRVLSGQKLGTWTRGLKASDSRTAGFFFNRASSSGREVTPNDAMSLSAVFAAVRLISQTIGMLPLTVYQSKPDGGKKPAQSNPAYRLLKWTPNPWMTAKNFRQLLEVHRLLWGNAYAEIVWNYGGSAAELWPIEPWRVKPEIYQGNLRYVIDGGRSAPIAKDDMLHIPLISFDGVSGQSFVDFAIDSLGLNLSAQDFAASFFANGATTSGILTHDGLPAPTEDQRKQIRDGWEGRHQGQGKGYRTGVLWGGWKYAADGGSVDPEKSQLNEQRSLGVAEVARWLNVPPSLLRDLSRATWSNIEEEQISAVVYSWQPVAIDYEQEFDRKLLSPPQTYCKHNFAGLLRGNSKDRSEFYNKIFQVGGVTVNRILELEDEDPIGPLGDLRFVPLNMQTLQEAKKKADAPPPEVKPAPSPTPAPVEDVPADDVGLAWIAETLERLQVKESHAIRRAAAQPSGFLSWMDKFYEGHIEVLTAALVPPTATAKFKLNAFQLAERWVADSKELLLTASEVKPAQFAESINHQLESWKNTRPSQLISRLMKE